MSLKNYYTFSKHIKNWRTYFKRLHDKRETATYITKGKSITINVPWRFFWVFKEIFMEDFYNIDSLLNKIPNTAVVLDVGCNVGFFSIMVASKKSNATIYAFDPIQSNTKLFGENIALNKGLDKHIIVTNKAVTGVPKGNINIYFDDKTNDTAVASIYENFAENNNNVVSVETVTLQDIIKQNNITKIDLLKLDCEGSEYPILYESPNEVWSYIQNIALETHELDNNKQNANAMIEFLESKNYKVEKHQAENMCYSIRAFKKNV